MSDNRTEKAEAWSRELERKSGLVFGHMCGGKKFRRGDMHLCNLCWQSESYNWHITEEEWLMKLLSQ